MRGVLLLLHVTAIGLRDVRCDELIKERSVSCRSSSMDVFLTFARPFKGSVFTENGFDQTECRWTGDGKEELSIQVPLTNTSLCGISVKEEEGEFTVKLIVSPVEGLIVDGFAALAVRCVYATEEVTLTLPAGRPLQISSSGISSAIVSGTGGTPSLSMQILEGHGITGQPITKTSVGNRITLDVMLKDTSIYDFFVHSCHAHDGSNSPDASISVIDENGCGVRLSRAIDIPTMVSESSNGGPKHAFLFMYGFQFTSSQFVHFECQVRPCVHSCKIKQCTAAPTLLHKKKKIRRVKRDFLGLNEIRDDVKSEDEVRNAAVMETLRLSTVIQIEPQHAMIAAAALVADSSNASSSFGVSAFSNQSLFACGTALLLFVVMSSVLFLFVLQKYLRKPSQRVKRTSPSNCPSESAYSITSLYN